MNVAHIFSDSTGEYNSSRHRGQTILDGLRRAGHTVSFCHVDAWMKDSRRSELADADLIVIERVLVEESVDRAKFWYQRGKPIVIDIDDAYQLLQPYEISGNQAAKFWQSGEVDITYPGGVKVTKKLSTTPLEQFRRGLQYCAGLTMPSRILAEDWSPYAKTWFVPNYLNHRDYLKYRVDLPRKSDQILIGWGGSMSHKVSFEKSGVAIALRNVLKQRPNARVFICGDQRILDIIQCPPSQVIYQPYVTWNEWARCLARFDIGLAPLHGRYDWSRSAIKSEEFSMMGIPFVGTRCPTYKDFVDAGVGVYVSDGPETPDAIQARAVEWESKLLDMIDHYPDYAAQAVKDMEYSKEWWIDNKIGSIVATYEKIIASAR